MPLFKKLKSNNEKGITTVKVRKLNGKVVMEKIEAFFFMGEWGLTVS
ncbi:hypothetical protein [Photobacterium sanctipauli]|nr:hypothetical protein [Photobacterium sanctipauli]